MALNGSVATNSTSMNRNLSPAMRAVTATMAGNQVPLDKDDSALVLYIGIGAGALVLCLICLIIFAAVRKRKKQRRDQSTSLSATSTMHLDDILAVDASTGQTFKNAQANVQYDTLMPGDSSRASDPRFESARYDSVHDSEMSEYARPPSSTAADSNLYHRPAAVDAYNLPDIPNVNGII